MFYFIVIFGVIIDYITKKIASEFLFDRINILSDAMYLKYVENVGIAFSIKIPGIILKPLTILLIILIFYYYKKERKSVNENNTKILLDIGFGLILAGAIGNGIERVFYGRVIDFIGVKYFSVFNVADAMISLGFVVIIYLLYKNALTKKN